METILFFGELLVFGGVRDGELTPCNGTIRHLVESDGNINFKAGLEVFHFDIEMRAVS